MENTAGLCDEDKILAALQLMAERPLASRELDSSLNRSAG